jgi:hypothetical protein
MINFVSQRDLEGYGRNVPCTVVTWDGHITHEHAVDAHDKWDAIARFKQQHPDNRDQIDDAYAD